MEDYTLSITVIIFKDILCLETEPAGRWIKNTGALKSSLDLNSGCTVALEYRKRKIDLYAPTSINHCIHNLHVIYQEITRVRRKRNPFFFFYISHIAQVSVVSSITPLSCLLLFVPKRPCCCIVTPPLLPNLIV